MNKINFIENLQLIVKTDILVKREDEFVNKSSFNADWIRRYLLADSMPNLIKFTFSICFEYRLSSDEIAKLTNSFKIHSFFVDRQWTNVKCLFDRIRSCAYLFSAFDDHINSNSLA